MKLSTMSLAAVLLAAPALTFAQTPTPGAHDFNVHQRKVDQQRRIAQGVRTGELTPRETAHLERGESRINRETRDMREDNGGRLNARDRRIVHRQQNRMSRRIYRDKHNGHVA